jgi:hypothetical protein
MEMSELKNSEIKKYSEGLGMVVHVYNPSFEGDRDEEDHDLKYLK